MKSGWDPHPTFTGLPAYRPDADQAYIDACNERMWDLYTAYARDLDTHHPYWHFEILTVTHPPHELAELAQQRRDQEGKP